MLLGGGKDTKDIKDTKDGKDTKDRKDRKDRKDTRDGKDRKDTKDTQRYTHLTPFRKTSSPRACAAAAALPKVLTCDQLPVVGVIADPHAEALPMEPAAVYEITPMV